MHELLQKLFEDRIQHFVANSRKQKQNYPKADRKLESLAKRSAEIVKVKASGRVVEESKEDDNIRTIKYQVHYQYLIRQKGTLYMEEEVEERVSRLFKNSLVSDQEIFQTAVQDDQMDGLPLGEQPGDDKRLTFEYNRLKAVQYAERWWNNYNPAYIKFQNDCTNFISQCLRAGEAPMKGYPNRNAGWWMQYKNWSYSWAIAHSLRLYLAGSKSGLRAVEVSSPDQLLLGDVICYDFEGDGRFNHNTIVTGKDAFGMPLVNAHTYNSRMRYWQYEDSSAYTPNIKYKFFSIVSG